MGPSGHITHVIGYIGYIGYIGSIALFGTGICRFCIWVELPVQRRLCPIFVRNVGSPDIHECFRGLTGSQRTPGFRASQCISQGKERGKQKTVPIRSSPREPASVAPKHVSTSAAHAACHGYSANLLQTFGGPNSETR